MLCSCYSVMLLRLPENRKEEPAPGMRLWHKALGQVRSSSQLSLCVQQLQKSVTWDQSVMKVVSDASLLLPCSLLWQRMVFILYFIRDNTLRKNLMNIVQIILVQIIKQNTHYWSKNSSLL